MDVPGPTGGTYGEPVHLAAHHAGERYTSSSLDLRRNNQGEALASVVLPDALEQRGLRYQAVSGVIECVLLLTE